MCSNYCPGHPHLITSILSSQKLAIIGLLIVGQVLAAPERHRRDTNPTLAGLEVPNTEFTGSFGDGFEGEEKFVDATGFESSFVPQIADGESFPKRPDHDHSFDEQGLPLIHVEHTPAAPQAEFFPAAPQVENSLPAVFHEDHPPPPVFHVEYGPPPVFHEEYGPPPAPHEEYGPPPTLRIEPVTDQ